MASAAAKDADLSWYPPEHLPELVIGQMLAFPLTQGAL